MCNSRAFSAKNYIGPGITLSSCVNHAATVDDAIDDKSTRTVSRGWGGLVPIIICVCGLGAIGFVRRRVGEFPIEKPEPFRARSISLPRVTPDADRALEAVGSRGLRRRSPAVRFVLVTCLTNLKGPAG